MFTELAPLAKSTTLNVIVTAEGENLRVIVMPKAAKEGENPALSTPLSLVGTPAELDAQFATIITGYTASRTSLEEALLASQTVMEAAKKDSVSAAAKKTTKAATSTPAAPAKNTEPEEKEADDIDLFD